jgi:hypothetical protein
MVCTELRGMPECSGLQQSGTSTDPVQAYAQDGKNRKTKKVLTVGK